MPKRQPIPKYILKQANKAETRRGTYQALTNAGYSNRQIADEYGVNHRTVWERTHDRVYSPKEKPPTIRKHHKK